MHRSAAVMYGSMEDATRTRKCFAQRHASALGAGLVPNVDCRPDWGVVSTPRSDTEPVGAQASGGGDRLLADEVGRARCATSLKALMAASERCPQLAGSICPACGAAQHGVREAWHTQLGARHALTMIRRVQTTNCAGDPLLDILPDRHRSGRGGRRRRRRREACNFARPTPLHKCRRIRGGIVGSAHGRLPRRRWLAVGARGAAGGRAGHCSGAYTWLYRARPDQQAVPVPCRALPAGPPHQGLLSAPRQLPRADAGVRAVSTRPSCCKCAPWRPGGPCACKALSVETWQGQAQVHWAQHGVRAVLCYVR